MNLLAEIPFVRGFGSDSLVDGLQFTQGELLRQQRKENLEILRTRPERVQGLPNDLLMVKRQHFSWGKFFGWPPPGICCICGGPKDDFRRFHQCKIGDRYDPLSGVAIWRTEIPEVLQKSCVDIRLFAQLPPRARVEILVPLQKASGKRPPSNERLVATFYKQQGKLSLPEREDGYVGRDGGVRVLILEHGSSCIDNTIM